jgi:hypothetical protein
MSRHVRRLCATLVVLVLVAAACGNSGDDDAASEDPAGSPTTDAGADGGDGDGDQFVSLSGVPGVTDDAISYAVIGTRSNNPLGTCILDCYRDGIDAYFAFRNAEGGIYGRELKIAEELDDELLQNQVRALEVISSDKVFGNFNATLVASGWADLDGAGVPTYVWPIHAPEVAGRMNIFGSMPAICADCSARAVPYAAMVSEATTVASIGYGVSENSKVCTNTVARSVEMYSADTGVEVGYVNDSLDFGLPNGIGPEVTAMKRAGVDFISTCMDLNAMKTLAQELQRQGMDDVVLYHPNTYNHPFVAEAGPLFEGDIVSVQFRPFEADPGDSALADFLEWMEQTGSELSELAMVGWINADLAFKGLLAAGPEFDRASVVAATNRLTAYDADGLIAPIDWTRQHNPPTEGDTTNDYAQECAAFVRIKGGEFETVAPADKPWLCWSNDSLDWSEPEPTDFG